MNENLHTKDRLMQVYGQRDWQFYRRLVADGILYGQPGLWLDLGVGIGLSTECATRFGIKCIGLEGSVDGVEIARRRYPEMDIRQHLLENALPFEDGSISTIICNQLIEHLPPETARYMLRECYRVLRPKGAILINSPCKYVRKQRLKKTHINMYTPKGLEREVGAVGFNIVRVNNSPRAFLGNFPFLNMISRIVFRLLPLDLLSGSANCVAIKPSELQRDSC